MLAGAGCPLYSLAWSPDGRHLAASSDDGWVVMYDYGRGAATKKWRMHEGGGMVLRCGGERWCVHDVVVLRWSMCLCHIMV